MVGFSVYLESIFLGLSMAFLMRYMIASKGFGNYPAVFVADVAQDKGITASPSLKLRNGEYDLLESSGIP